MNMKKFKVLTGKTVKFGRTVQMFFTEVWADSPDDAVLKFDSITLLCGKPYVEETVGHFIGGWR
jgi:hypothetical protein